MRTLLLALTLIGCVKLPHVEPEPRAETTQFLTSVQVRSDCDGDDVVAWAEAKGGTGVMISERHVLTAQHVVRCPTIPVVHVTFVTVNGMKTLRMYVTKEDPDQDIAKLEIGSAEYFHMDVPPPKLWTKGSATNEMACAWPNRTICGVVDTDNTVIKGMEAVHGDSGSAVYTEGLDYVNGVYTENDGLLLGIIVRGGKGYTRIAPVTPEWLEGT